MHFMQETSPSALPIGWASLKMILELFANALELKSSNWSYDICVHETTLKNALQVDP
jgi:hypothetical protein